MYYALYRVYGIALLFLFYPNRGVYPGKVYSLVGIIYTALVVCSGHVILHGCIPDMLAIKVRIKLMYIQTQKSKSIHYTQLC